MRLGRERGLRGHDGLERDCCTDRCHLSWSAHAATVYASGRYSRLGKIFRQFGTRPPGMLHGVPRMPADPKCTLSTYAQGWQVRRVHLYVIAPRGPQLSGLEVQYLFGRSRRTDLIRLARSPRPRINTAATPQKCHFNTYYFPPSLRQLTAP